jgi:aminoglycoside phosphotransferase (APT) family kinase protein
VTAPAELEAVLEALRPRLGAPAAPPEPLGGGITNRNFRVRLGADDVVIRLPGNDTELLGIDREAEHRASVAASDAGVGPEVLAYLEAERCLVTRFIHGRPLRPEELRTPQLLGEAGRALRAVHAGPPLPVTFDPWAIVEAHHRLAVERGARIPAAHADAVALAGRIRPLLQGPEHEPVPCHDDLLTANLLHDGSRLRIVDWEYAGMNDRFFDLANLSVNNGLEPEDDRLLLRAYFGAATPRRLARLRLMRLMSDFREAMWGVVQSAISELDFDFEGYADEHFRRMLEAGTGPAFQRWAEQAADG